jgi:putative membrane protein
VTANDQQLAKQSQNVEKSAVQLERSATAVEQSATAVEQSADRNTVLAADRTVLAAERTYAAWVRTGLAALASGAGAQALLGGILPSWCRTVIGTLLGLFSVFCFLAAVWRERSPRRPPCPDLPRVPTPLLVLINGSLVLVAIAVVIGIWVAAL